MIKILNISISLILVIHPQINNNTTLALIYFQLLLLMAKSYHSNDVRDKIVNQYFVLILFSSFFEAIKSMLIHSICKIKFHLKTNL